MSFSGPMMALDQSQAEKHDLTIRYQAKNCWIITRKYFEQIPKI